MDNFFDRLESDTKKVTYRIFSAQIIKITKDKLLSILQTKGIKSVHIKTIANFLDTNIGIAILSICAGLSVPYISPFKHDKYTKNLAKELRMDGAAALGNILINKISFNTLFTIDKLQKWTFRHKNGK